MKLIKYLIKKLINYLLTYDVKKETRDLKMLRSRKQLLPFLK